MLIKGATEKNRYRVSWATQDYQGKGTLIWPDGSRYEGEFYNGHLQGEGTFTWPDGSSYKGEWQNDLPQGQGVFTWPDGSQYEGEWEGGKSKAEDARLKAEEEATKKAEGESRLGISNAQDTPSVTLRRCRQRFC